MGYSDSLKTVENRKELLGALMNGEPMAWECEPGSEKTIAYQVRECQKIARENPEVFPGLARAANFEVFIAERGRVAARPKRAVVVTPVPTVMVGESMTPEKKPKEKEKEPPAAEEAIEGGQTAATIVQRWISSTGLQILHFPQAALSIEDLKKLHKWAVEQKVLLFFKDPMITLRPYDEELAVYAFDPEEDLP